MGLIVTYKNGNTLTFEVEYVHFDEDGLTFTQKHQCKSIYTMPVTIKVEHIVSYEIIE